MANTDYVKQIQTKVNREIRKINKEWGVSKSQVREKFEQVGINADSPSEEELKMVFDAMVGQFSQENNNISDSGELVVATPEPQEVVHDTDGVQPSEPTEEEIEPIALDQQEPLTEQGQEEINSIVAATPNLPSQQPQSGAGLIPQSEVANMVNQAFAGQPPQIQEQITEYAMERTFSNVSQVQEFLEQLRGMEFNLLVNALNDHFARRGSMLNVLNSVLSGQKAKDEEASQAFFASFNSRLAAFQNEMNARLTKQSL